MHFQLKLDIKLEKDVGRDFYPLVIDWIVKSGRCQYGITLSDGRLKRLLVKD